MSFGDPEPRLWIAVFFVTDHPPCESHAPAKASTIRDGSGVALGIFENSRRTGSRELREVLCQ